MPHKINLIDKDGNQSEVTLPDYALDSTQQQLLKSMQALVRANPKAQKAYEDLIGATKDAVTAAEDAADQQKKDAKELKNAVNRASDQQVSALKQFRTNFSDRVGRDMRDTFTAGGNILTAAIKTATVGLAAGAGLLYKTFMDTSDAFRQLAQSGLGGAGGTGREAQDAVGNLTRLGMSANEAASLLTSFGRASAVLGKANFSKFVSGIASAGSFAADLGLTLEEAAEFAAEELDMRQRVMAGDLQLGDAQAKSITAAIRETQRLASVMGVSMKDIVADKKQFLDNNANIQNLMAKTAVGRRESLMAEINSTIGASSALGDQAKKLFQSLVNSAALQVPLMDSNLQNIADQGTAGQQLVNLTMQMNRAMYEQGKLPKSFLLQFQSLLSNMDDQTKTQLGYFIGDNEFARTIQNASFDVQAAGKRLVDAVNGVGNINDPMVTAGANFQNVLNQISGAFVTVRNNVLGQFAGPLNNLVKALTNTGLDLSKLSDADKVDFQNKMRAIEDDKTLSDKVRQEKIDALLKEKGLARSRTFIVALYEGLDKIVKSFMDKFFPNLEGAGNQADGIVTEIIKFVDELSTNISTWISELEGKTFGEKLKSAAIGMIKIGLGLLMTAIKETAWAFFTSPAGWGAVLGLIGAAVTMSLIKSAAIAGIGTLINTIMGRSATTAASSVSSAGNTLAAVIRRVAGQIQAAAGGLGAGAAGGAAGGAGRGRGRGGRFSRIASKASVAGLIAGVGGGIAADALDSAGHTKTAAAVDTVANVAGMAGTGAMIGSIIPGVGTAIGAGVGAAAGLGMSLYQNWDTWFGSPEAEQAVADKGQEAIEGMDAEGMAAMAMDPEHIKAVTAALRDFNGVSVSNITAGLTAFNPVLTSLFKVITQVKTQVIEIVNTKLGAFLKTVTSLNAQGALLPTTTKNINDLAEKIVSIKVEPIFKLSTAFNALASALKNFSALTTSTWIGRAFDWLTGKQDTTADVIKVLNNFASQVDSDKLLKAAEATQAFNTAMQGLLGPVNQTTPVTTANNNNSTPTNTSTTTPAPQMDKQTEMVNLLNDLKTLFTEQRRLLESIKKNTGDSADHTR